MTVANSRRTIAAEPQNGGATALREQPTVKRSSWIEVVLTRYATLLLVVALIVIFSSLSSHFLTVANWQNMLVIQSVATCMSLAAMVPLVVGEFDLSLGYLLGFLTMLGAALGGMGYGVYVVVSAMVGAGIVVGIINGILTVKLHISSFIATLGTGILLSGLTLAVSGGQVLFTGIPPEILTLGQSQVAGLGPTVWCTIVLIAILFFIFEYTPFGRKLYAIGGSERVAFLAGVPTGTFKIVSFALAGCLVGIGAIFELGQSGSANASFGPELLLPAYAACFLSVISYRPGFYNVPGIVVAILLLAIGFNGINLLGAPFWAQPIFNGGVLLIAVVAARAESRHIKR